MLFGFYGIARADWANDCQRSIPQTQQRPESFHSQAAAGGLLGLDWRPSRFRECQSHDGESAAADLRRTYLGSWGARASGLSHLTYETTGTFTYHQLDQPPFPCKHKLQRRRRGSQGASQWLLVVKCGQRSGFVHCPLSTVHCPLLTVHCSLSTCFQSSALRDPGRHGADCQDYAYDCERNCDWKRDPAGG
jgi:hypothetical protein